MPKATGASVKARIESLLQRQKAGEHLPCPRCGLPRMEKVLAHNALSRHANVYVCSPCGMDEAMRDWSDRTLPLEKWSAADWKKPLC